MPHLRRLLCAALATGLFLTSGTAEARFGKRSSSSSSDEKKVHDATPVGQDDDDDDSGGSSSGGSSATDTLNAILTLISLASDISEAHTSYSAPQGTVVAQRPPEPRARGPLLVRMGMEGQSLGEGNGSAVAVNLGVEELRWGVAGSATSMTLPTDDGTPEEDTLRLYAMHLTYALLSSEQGRLRVEAGVSAAKAPDITLVGPSFTLSFERCLFGALDVEGSGQVVPVPFLRLDAQAGLGLHLGVLTLRGGWRWMLLDDQGHVDGEAHRDTFSGPYLGLGLNF